MFTALILICAGGMKDPNTCYYQAHDAFFESREECVGVIADSLTNFPELFEFYDERIETYWKVTDIHCVNWNEIRV